MFERVKLQRLFFSFFLNEEIHQNLVFFALFCFILYRASFSLAARFCSFEINLSNVWFLFRIFFAAVFKCYNNCVFLNVFLYFYFFSCGEYFLLIFNIFYLSHYIPKLRLEVLEPNIEIIYLWPEIYNIFSRLAPLCSGPFSSRFAAAGFSVFCVSVVHRNKI